VLVQVAMISVGVYGSEALRSLRYAAARLLVAVSLGIIALSVVYFLLPGHTLWRSNLFYAMFLAIGLLFGVRVLLGGLLGTAAFRRRILVWAPAIAPIACASWESAPRPVRDRRLCRHERRRAGGGGGDQPRRHPQPHALRGQPGRQRSGAGAGGGATRCRSRTCCGSRPPASTSTISRRSSSARPGGSISTR
jgi:hypothetical protein